MKILKGYEAVPAGTIVRENFLFNWAEDPEDPHWTIAHDNVGQRAKKNEYCRPVSKKEKK